MLSIGISKNTYWGPGTYSLSYCLPCNLVHCSKMKELRIWYPSIYIVIVVRFGCIYLSDQTNNGLLKNQLTFLKFCRGSFQTHIILMSLQHKIETFKIFISKQLWYKLNLFYFKFCFVVGTHILLITYISKRISIPITKPNLKQNRYSMYHNCTEW